MKTPVPEVLGSTFGVAVPELLTAAGAVVVLVEKSALVPVEPVRLAEEVDVLSEEVVVDTASWALAVNGAGTIRHVATRTQRA